MYARLIQLTAKPGQVKDCVRALVDQGLPLLKQQPGFVDAVALTSEAELDKFVGITFWKSREDAERYVGGQGRKELDSIRPILQNEPASGYYNLEASTIHSLGNVGRAASQR